MRARLVCVGKPKNPHADALCSDYAARIAKLGLPFETLSVAEVRAGGRFSDDHVREREAAHLQAAIAKGERVVALAPQGEALSSETLAERLPRWVRPAACFVVGGPLGLHAEFLAAAEVVWSLGPGTLPHELARVVAAEQIYRAMTLIRGVPYHK